jgi:type II secretory pathway pseudopilin PulG
MRNRKCKFRSGLTLVELVIAMTINLLVVFAAGALLVGGNRAWQRTYNSANKKLKQDALATISAFGSVGRKANRLGYIIYKIENGGYVPALPVTTDPEEVVSGDAVEFRYWDVELDKADSHSLLDVTKTATAYAFFYLDDGQLKVDYGQYPPGAVPDGGGSKNSAGVITKVLLAENVSVDKDSGLGAFSHTVIGGTGQGCVRINIILTDPEDNESIRVATATLMRNIWPR